MPRLSKGWKKHRLYNEAHLIFTALCLDAEDGQVIVLLGPSQCGKSHLFESVVDLLTDLFNSKDATQIGVINLQVESVEEGRAKTKWLVVELLKLAKHPMYEHIGEMDEERYYRPSRGRDEKTARTALKAAFKYRKLRRVCLDEGHLLTRTKDAELRASILESLKSSCAIKRTLIVAGGYELAYKGLFDSPHFVGRLTIYDYGSYSVNNPADVLEWMRLSKSFGKDLQFDPPSLLIDWAPYTLTRSNGVAGNLEKWLWECSVYAKARKSKITIEILQECSPSANAVRTTRADIEKGRSALAKLAVVVKAADKPEEDAASAKENLRKPYERNPNRGAIQKVELLDDD